MLLDPPKRPTIAIKDLYSLPFAFWRSECHRNGCVNGISDFRWDINGKLFRNNSPVGCPAGAHGTPCHQYKALLLSKGLIFQSEASYYAYLLLKNNPQIAQALAVRFPIILLDEAQDTSLEQMALLDLINQSGLESLFLIGDPDQAIYEWRNATPECFIDKLNDKNWKTLPLTANFRSSQLICNATYAFAKSLEHKAPSKAKGQFSDLGLKPVLLLYSDNIDDQRQLLIEHFISLCTKNHIEISPDNVAVVSRSNVHSDTNITGLWKSREVEFLARASFEWNIGSRKKAYEFCEKALFAILIKDFKDINLSIEYDLKESILNPIWRSIVIDVLTNLPDSSQSLGTWVNQTKQILIDSFSKLGISTRANYSLSSALKIKTSDQTVPHFKSTPLKDYFEYKSKNKYTISSIHGVKGETYDALMLIVECKTGRTLTPTSLNEGNLDQELMRIAYVAMTRPRKLLVVAIPKVKSRTTYPRFPTDIWDHLNI